MTDGNDPGTLAKDHPRAPIVVVTTSEETGYAQHIKTRSHALQADEPVAAGGTDSGPSPTELVLAGLGGCTSITLRMYAERKGWKLGTIEVSIAYETEGDVHRIARSITFSAPLREEQRNRLAEISEKTPVTRLLKTGVAIRTTVTGGASPATGGGAPPV
jgi:putative redox protein